MSLFDSIFGSNYDPQDPKTPQYWAKTLRDALLWREKLKISGDKDWYEASQRVVGIQPVDGVPTNRSVVIVNETDSLCDQFYSYLMHDDVYWTADPRRSEYYYNALNGREVMNFYWDRACMQEEANLCVRDVVQLGTCVAQVGWQTEKKQGANKSEGELPDEHAYYNAPFLERVRLQDFLFDPNAPKHDLKSSGWVARRYFRPRYQVEQDPDSNTALVNKIKTLNPNKWAISYMDDPWITSDKKEAYYKNDYLAIWHIWDKRFRTEYEIVEGMPDDFLIETDWMLPLDVFPFSLCKFIPIKDHHYGIGIPMLIKSMQDEINANRTQMFEWRRRIANQIYTVMLSQLPDIKSMDDFESAMMGQAISVQSHDAIRPVQIPPLPSDLFNIESSIRGDMTRRLGLDELMAGGRIPSRTSAREIDTRQSNFALKLRSRNRQVTAFLREIGKNIFALCQQLMIQDEIFKIAGPTAVYWDSQQAKLPENYSKDQAGGIYARISKTNLEGDYDIDLMPTAAPDVDPETEKSQFIALFQQLVQAAPILSSPQVQAMPNFRTILSEIFDKFSVKDESRFLPWATAQLQDPTGTAPAPTPPTVEQTGQGGQPPPAQPNSIPASSGALGATAGYQNIPS